MLLALPRTSGLLQWVHSCLTEQADTCCSSAAQGNPVWWPVAEHSTPSCTRHACAVAVGTMEVSSADVARSGLKGKGLKLLHHYPDLLWALGDQSTPDSSFTVGRIFPQQVWVWKLARHSLWSRWRGVLSTALNKHSMVQSFNSQHGQATHACWMQADAAAQQDGGSTAASQMQAAATPAEQLGSLSLSADDHDGANGHGGEAAGAAEGSQADAEASETGDMPQEATGTAAGRCCSAWAPCAQHSGSAHHQWLRDAPELCILLRGGWASNDGQLSAPCRDGL